MQSTLRLRTAALAALSVLPLAGYAASGNTFMNGQSHYGQPASAGTPARVVDIATANYVNVKYGETVSFASGAKTFMWTFDGLNPRAVSLDKIAPQGFVGKPFTIYVAKDPFTRGGR